MEKNGVEVVEYGGEIWINQTHLQKIMILITQTSTGTMVKRVPQEQMFVIEATLLENHFLPSSGFAMLMSVEDFLIS